MRDIHALDARFGGQEKNWALTTAAARYIAIAMTYNDVIRIADLKTRGERFERLRGEVRAGNGQNVATTEYLHPRAAEICGTLTVFIGRRLEVSRCLNRLLRRMFGKGRFVNTVTGPGYLAQRSE